MQRHDRVIAVHGRWLAIALVVAAAVLFAVGVLAPILTLKTLLVVENRFSIVSGLAALWQDRQYGLLVLVGGFSVVLPALKLVFLLCAANAGDRRLAGHVRRLAAIGRWAMLDVLVVAVLVASIRLGAIASVEVHYGLYVFAASVLLTSIASGLIARRHGLSGATA